MQQRRSAENNYSFKKWKTPLGWGKSSYLYHILQVGNKVHFFFLKSGSKDKTYVMTIPLYYPYRVYADVSDLGQIRGQFRFDGKKVKRNPKGGWKLVGKNFFNVIQNGRPLSKEVERYDKKISQYMIVSYDQWIEFTSCPPIWHAYDTTDFVKLFDLYTSKRCEGFTYWIYKEKERRKRKGQKMNRSGLFSRLRFATVKFKFDD